MKSMQRIKFKIINSTSSISCGTQISKMQKYLKVETIDKVTRTCTKITLCFYLHFGFCGGHFDFRENVERLAYIWLILVFL